MTTTSYRFFESAFPVQAAAPPVLARDKTRDASLTIQPAPQMPASLWRHTQNEDAAEERHHRTAGRMLLGTATLVAGSVVYAICQTSALMAGSRLHDAVAAFLR